MTTQRQNLSTYALTIGTYHKHRHFQVTANAERFIATLARYRAEGKFLLHAFAVMPDHVHLLLTPAIEISTARAVQFIKGGYSHATRAHASGEIWHPGYFEHRVRDPIDFAAQQRYIANNPTRANLLNHLHVHTAYPDGIDPAPAPHAELPKALPLSS